MPRSWHGGDASPTGPNVPPGCGAGRLSSMHIPAKVDYGIRALLALAAAGDAADSGVPGR